MAIVALSLSVGLGAAEVMLRIWLPQDLGLLAPWFEPHPIYRFRHSPNMDAIRSFSGPYRLQTNSRGVRLGREEPYESPGEIRVVVHGDSMAFGLGVDNEATFVEGVERRLRRTFPNVDVLNLGVTGHGPDQEYLLFREEGRKYHARVVVIAAYAGNDLLDLTRPNTAFRLEDGRLVYVPYHFSLARRLADTDLYRWVATRSHLLVLIRQTLVDRPLHDREVAARAAQAPPIELARAIYGEFVASIRKEGAEPLVVILPAQDQIVARVDPASPATPVEARLLRDALLHLCAAERLTCVDVLDTLAQHARPLDSLFLPDDDHYSAAGHALMAELLEEPLRRMLRGDGSW